MRPKKHRPLPKRVVRFFSSHISFEPGAKSPAKKKRADPDPSAPGR